MISRHLLGGTFEKAIAEAIERLHARDDKLKPCFVARDGVTGRFFQCASGLLAGGVRKSVRFEVPWSADGGNRAILPSDIAVYFHLATNRGDLEGLETAEMYEFGEGCLIQAVVMSKPEAIPPFARKLCEELLRLPPSALLEVDEFFQEAYPEN